MYMFLPNGAPLHSVESFLRPYRHDDPSRLELQFHRKWVAVHPMVLATIACAAQSVRDAGGQVEVPIIPDLPTLPYFIRMGLFEVLGLPRPRDIAEHEAAGRFIPLSQITDSDKLGQFIVDMIPLLHADLDEVAPIKYVISELVRNAL